jgi:exodeoxyribonuclease VII small subunit
MTLQIEKNDEMSYESSLEALHQIIEIVENPSTSLDDLMQHVQQADQLFEQCRAKLLGLETNLNKIL